MTKRAAVVTDGIVTNMILIDPDAAFVVLGSSIHPINAGSPVGIGWTYNGTNFIAPEPEPEEVI